MTNTHDNCNKIYKAIIQYCQSIFHLYEKKAFIMSIIKNCLSLINNALNIQKTSYSLTKMEQAGKLLNRKITPENTPPMLLSYRNADLTHEKNITERVLSIFKIKRDFVAVRIQNNQFTDLKNKKNSRPSKHSCQCHGLV